MTTKIPQITAKPLIIESIIFFLHHYPLSPPPTLPYHHPLPPSPSHHHAFPPPLPLPPSSTTTTTYHILTNTTHQRSQLRFCSGSTFSNRMTPSSTLMQHFSSSSASQLLGEMHSDIKFANFAINSAPIPSLPLMGGTPLKWPYGRFRG
jgi:hypothetical protein